MRILTASPHPDRSETLLFEELHRRGVEIEVLCDENAVRYNELKAAGVSVTKFTFRFRIDLSAIQRIRAKLKTGRVDIIHTFSKRSLLHMIIATSGIPSRIITYRGIIGNLSRWNPETRFTFMNKRVSKIICVCEAVRKYLLSIGIPSSRLITIYKGHDPSWYTSVSRNDLTQFGIPPKAFVVGCAARMRSRKGIDVLVKAAQYFTSQSVHFLLVGNVTDRTIKPLIKRKKLTSIVHLIGYRDNASALMGACDIFVMPSRRREGLPRAVIEAMAQGIPAIVTNVGGMPEIIDHQKDGLIVPAGDPDTLARSIETLVENTTLRRNMGEQALKKVRTHFDVQTTIKQTIELYDHVLNEP